MKIPRAIFHSSVMTRHLFGSTVLSHHQHVSTWQYIFFLKITLATHLSPDPKPNATPTYFIPNQFKIEKIKTKDSMFQIWKHLQIIPKFNQKTKQHSDLDKGKYI